MRNVMLLLALVAPTAFAATLSYDEAKALADRDEAALSADATHALIQAHGDHAMPHLATCAARVAEAGPPDMAKFVVVLELDAAGKVAATWRQGSTPLAVCFERILQGRTIHVPAKVPFYTSLEMTFTNDGDDQTQAPHRAP